MTATTPSGKSVALDLFAGLPRHYDRIAALFSFGQDPRWRRALADAVAPADDERILDVACGTGMVGRELRRRAACRITGLDQSPQMLAGARSRGDVYAELVEGEAEALPFPDGSFDALTFTYLLRYVDDPAATMRELARVVRPGGRIGMLEFHVPPWPLARPAWWLYTRVGLPVLGRAVSREWYDVGRFLGPSIDGFWRRHPLPEVVEMWRAAGIDGVLWRPMSLGGGIVMWGAKTDGHA